MYIQVRFVYVLIFYIKTLGLLAFMYACVWALKMIDINWGD